LQLQAISLRQVRFFVALAEAGNFSRAAEKMAISQPALSSAIRQVETLMGLRLFDRTTHRVTLTSAGLSFLPHAQRLLTTADNAFRDMGEAAHRGRTTIRIGAIPSTFPAIARAMATLDQDAAGVSLHLADGKSDELIADLHRGRIDLAICVCGRVEDGLLADLLVEDEMLLVVPVGHALDGVDSLLWSRLEGQEIVHFAGGSIGDLSRAAMRQHNLEPSSRYQVDQTDSLFGIIAGGLAVGVMPRLYTRRFAPEQVSLVSLVQPAIRRRIVMLRRKALAEEHPLGAWVADQLTPLLPGLLASH